MPTTAPHNDRGPLAPQRLALSPWRESQEPIIAGLSEDQAVAFARLLRHEGLAPLWSAWLDERPADSRGEHLPALLRPMRQRAIARYLMQRGMLDRALHALRSEGVAVTVIKGAELRERLYPQPALRPSADLDLLVRERERTRAVRALVTAGMQLDADPLNLSHEVCLRSQGFEVDLHWQLMRPGRARIDLAAEVTATAERDRRLPRPSPEGALLIALVHAPFAKHLNGPGSRLIRVLELDLLIRQLTPDWERVGELLTRAHLRTAAWATLYWQQQLLDTPIPADVLRTLRPRAAKRAWLTAWIEGRWSQRLHNARPLVHLGFTLPLHESTADALHALGTARRARRSGERIRRELTRVCGS